MVVLSSSSVNDRSCGRAASIVATRTFTGMFLVGSTKITYIDIAIISEPGVLNPSILKTNASTWSL